jgi:phosphoenolpyruvate carboxykinase (ATP)
VPQELLAPRATWSDPDAYDATASRLARLFGENFERYVGRVSPDVAAAGPLVAVC